MSPLRKTFSNVTDRDAWIDRHFPERKCSNSPGCYKVPGGWISVFLETVTVSPRIGARLIGVDK